jgi:hypothetical protein
LSSDVSSLAVKILRGASLLAAYARRLFFVGGLSDPHLRGLATIFSRNWVPITQGATGRRWPGIGSASAWQRLGEDMQFVLAHEGGALKEIAAKKW